MRLLAAAVGVSLLVGGGLAGNPARAVADAVTPLPAGTYCQGPQLSQPAAGPKKVIMLDLENESASSVQSASDAPFENNILSTQCGSFATTAMHSTTHGSESNYFAEVSGLNAAIGTGSDAAARFGLSDCPPDSTSSSCAYGGGHFAATVPSIFSQVEQQFGTSGWKTYADDMPSNCAKADSGIYATVAGKSYPKYVARHNPALYFNGIACPTQVVPSGSWQTGQGPLYTDLMSGNLPVFSFLVPNDIENGHDPARVNGVTVAGGTSSIGNGDNYLANLMSMIQASPDYQNGNLVVMITYDEGFKAGPVAGENAVGENCANPDISAQATSCQVLTFLVSRYTPNYVYPTYMNQFGLLAASQRLIGVSPILGHAADSTTPDIVAGTAAVPNPFNLAASGSAPPPPATVPTAPTAVTATAGDSSAAVSFTTPTSTGGAPITNYTVTASPGGLSATGTTRPITVGGLTNGTSYTFTVTATNSAGEGPASDPSGPVTPSPTTNLLVNGGFESGTSGVNPYSTSSKPAIVTSTVHSGANALQVNNASAATTGFNAPVIPGTSLTAGQSLTGACWVRATGSNYQARLRFSEGKTYTVIGETISAGLVPGVWTQISVPGTVLKTGDQMIMSGYTTTQVAGGPGLVWDDCSVTTPGASTTNAPPGAPTAVTATAGDSTAAVAFTPPASNGGSAITSYTVTSTPGNVTASGSSSPITVNGLTNGTSYTFAVLATNAIGSGPQSAASNAVVPTVPASPPTPPLSLTAAPQASRVALAWSTPASNGGGAITDYVVQYALAGSGSWATFPDGVSTTTSALVTGLSNGTAYDFQVAAVNGAGQSPYSATMSATPAAAAPNAPTIGNAVAGNGQAVVNFTPPGYDGGSPITSYTVTSSPGNFTATGSGSPLTVAGLSNGTSYTFTVLATNSVGPGPASAATAPVTPRGELLPDPGFESGNGGWVAFKVGTLTRITTPVHAGSRSLSVAATSATATLVGLTQNSVVSNTVAGRSYTASCYVRATSANLDVQIRFLEYDQSFGSSTHFQTVSLAKVPTTAWTLIQVTSASLKSGDRMVPQIYSTTETTKTGRLLYDDCSVIAA